MVQDASFSIKASAKLAKKRLVSGYWNDIRQEREKFISHTSGKDIQKMNEAYARKIKRDLTELNAPDEDAVLYKKVCRLLNQDTFVLNPISRLIDHSVYDKLSDSEKQLYLLKLSTKYNELQNRYYNEREHRNNLKQSQY